MCAHAHTHTHAHVEPAHGHVGMHAEYAWTRSHAHPGTHTGAHTQGRVEAVWCARAHHWRYVRSAPYQGRWVGHVSEVWMWMLMLMLATREVLLSLSE
jgi:hypothetical protein